MLLVACGRDQRVDELQRDVAALQRDVGGLRADVEVCPEEVDFALRPERDPTCREDGIPAFAAVVPLSEDVVVVDPVCWHAIADHPDVWPQLLRAIPHWASTSDVDPDGVRLSGLRHGSPLTAIGLHNGDVIGTIDGYPAYPWPPVDLDQPVHAITGVRRGEDFELYIDVAHEPFAASCRPDPASVEEPDPLAMPG